MRYALIVMRWLEYPSYFPLFHSIDENAINEYENLSCDSCDVRLRCHDGRMVLSYVTSLSMHALCFDFDWIGFDLIEMEWTSAF